MNNQHRDDECARCGHVREAHFEQFSPGASVAHRSCNGQVWNSESEHYVECECGAFEEVAA